MTGGYLPLLSRVFILAACLGLLWPWAGLAACRPPISKKVDKPWVAVSGWERHTGFREWAGGRTGEGLLQPGEELRLAKAPAATKKKG